MNILLIRSAVRPRSAFFCALAVALLVVALHPFVTFADKKAPAAYHDKLFDVFFLTDKEVFVVGYPGLILHSTDAGVTWESRTIVESEPLYAIDFPDDKHGWVVGRLGLIYKTSDRGKTWTRQKTGVDKHLFDVDFADAQHGIVVGHFGTILTTEDGGDTWVHHEFQLMNSATINGLQMTGPKTAVFVGEYPIWETELTDDVTVEQISAMWRTEDGGNTWSRMGGSPTKTLFDVYFIDEKTGYTVGVGGTLSMTEDGGETWKSLDTPHDNVLLKITRAEDAVYIAGTEGTALRVQGDKVTPLDTKIYTWLCGIGFGDKNHGVVVGGRGTLMYTADGGKTWTKHPIK